MLTMRSGLSRDGWAGLAVLIFSSVLFALTFNLPEMPLVPVGPGFYPRILLCFTGGLGLWLLIADSRRFKTVEGMKHEGKSDPTGTAAINGLQASSTGLSLSLISGRFRAVFLHFGLFAAYVSLLSPLGFRLATLGYVAASSYLLEPPQSYRGWLRILILSLAAAFLTFYIFERYLAVLLPRGRWTSF